MSIVRKLLRKMVKNNFAFSVVDSVLSFLPQKNRQGGSELVKSNLEKLPDPIILNYADFKIHVDRKSNHDRDMYYDYLRGDYLDPLLSQVMKEYLKPGDTFLDIGSNNGFFSLLASNLVGSQGRVYAFEPSVSTYGRLVKNLELNGFENIRAFNIALGNKKGELTFYDYGTLDGSNSFVKMKNGEPKIVKMDTLDSIMEQEGTLPDFVKIDVEGFEKEVLLGSLKSILHKERIKVVLEYNRHILRKKGEDYSSIIKLLNDHGFQIHMMSDSERRVLGDEVHSHKDIDPFGCNLLAMK